MKSGRALSSATSAPQLLLLISCLILLAHSEPAAATAAANASEAAQASVSVAIGSGGNGDSTSTTMRPSVAAAQLDLADRMAMELADWANGLSEAHGSLGAIRDAKYARKTLAFVNHIGNFAKKLRIGTTLFTFLASLLLPTETEVLAGSMLRRFQEVNQKLDDLQRQLRDATGRLQVTHEAGEALAPYRDCHNAVRNGVQKLSGILASMEGARTRHQLARLAEEFTGWYETSQLDAQLMNLRRAATRESTASVGPNLFRAYANLHDCSTSRLAELMLGVVQDLELGAELQLAYQLFRNGPDRADEEFQRARNGLYQLRAVFDRVYWYCLDNIVVVASSSARKLMEETTTLGTPEAAKHVLTGLERRFHLFKWAVAIGATELLPVSTLESGNYFQLPTAPRLLVMFADAEQMVRCADANRTQARLVFHCPNDTCAIAASSGIVGSRTCPGISAIGAALGEAEWLAAMMLSREEPCSLPNACNGHGECHHRAGLTRPVCICEPEFQGDRCAIKEDPAAVSMKLIADMRDSVGEFAGVQTSVDVYYKLLDVQSNLIRELRGLSACTDLSGLVSSDTISEALYMAESYGQLLKGRRTLDQFGELMQTHVGGRNLDYFLKSLLQRLLGTNALGLPGRGMVHLFKRCWATAHSQPTCSKRYAQSVQRLMTSLVLMDEAVGESLLTYFSWKRERTTPADKLVLNYLVNAYKNRTAQLRDHWRAQSCPALARPERPLGPGLASWQQRFCNASHSYAGLELSVSCTGLSQPRTAKITCQRGPDGSLAWSQQPICDPVWSPWSAWSACSVTCGNGRRSRHRCYGDDCSRREWSNTPCAQVDCCVARFGEGRFFRCNGWASANRCVSRERVCDGVSDCPDASDEASCDFVRAGSLVSLRAKPFQAYAINCYCASRCLFQPVNCYMKYCANWYSGCSDQYTHYNIYSPDRPPGEVIHSGDTIGLMYDWGRHNWLSCTGRNSKCTTRNCPGGDVSRVNSGCGGEKFVIYSVENTGRCRGQRNCAGRPIRRGEEIALQRPHGWLSAPALDREIRVRNCLRSSSLARARGCPNEVWRIYH